MRHCVVALGVVCIIARAPAADEAKPLTPAEAAKKVDEQVTLQMVVKSALARGSRGFLDSEANYRDGNNFTVLINRAALDKFKAAGIEDPAAQFKGKTVLVTGTVTLYQNRPQIVLTGPSAIKIVGDPEPAKLDGEWTMVSGQADGQAMPAEMVKTGKRVAKDGETTITIGGRLYFKAKFTVDPAKSPKTIDYDMVEGVTKGKKQLGIYKLDGDTLTFCFAKPGGDRPTDFTAAAGSGRTLSVWKREKK